MEQNQIDQSVRLKKLIKALNFNQSSFAKSLGMAQPNISRMVNSGGNISIEILNRVALQFTQVNLHWLLTGNGEMFLNESQQLSPQVNEPQAAYGKGRLEALEDRVEKLEMAIKKCLPRSTMANRKTEKAQH